jgi:hypothetical protein
MQAYLNAFLEDEGMEPMGTLRACPDADLVDQMTREFQRRIDQRQGRQAS